MEQEATTWTIGTVLTATAGFLAKAWQRAGVSSKKADRAWERVVGFAKELESMERANEERFERIEKEQDRRHDELRQTLYTMSEEQKTTSRAVHEMIGELRARRETRGGPVTP